ncbi:hypothetical protein ACFFRR_009616 [Megaselia abdita]
MEINTLKLHLSLSTLKFNLKTNDLLLNNFLAVKDFTRKDVENIYEYLSRKILDIEYTELIANIFDYNSLSYIITCLVQLDGRSIEYQRQCFALSILLKTSPDLKKFAINLFDKNIAPFEKFDIESPPVSKKYKVIEESLSDIEVVKCCYNLLNADSDFFKGFWNWSIFVNKFLHKGEGLQKLYTNQILKILNSISSYQMQCINSDISDEHLIKFREEQLYICNVEKCVEEFEVKESVVKLDISNKMIVNIENVLLPIFNYENSVNYKNSEMEIVYTSSTLFNLRSIAMGITSGKAVCLTGPVGCGKTTLTEFIAGKTGRIRKLNEIKSGRKSDDFDENQSQPINGFLRIQLGDQTDSKMLLGQYKCTDVPGEFIWLPGVLTQAVMNGHWILLEDLDSATQDVITIFRNLFENNFLTVSGYRECIKVHSGFQVFVTTRSGNFKSGNQKSHHHLLEKYLFTINILPLNRKELITVVKCNYPNLVTAAEKVVDIYLLFSNENHCLDENNIEQSQSDSNNTQLRENCFKSISTRTVSTRDLIKLCKRSSPLFSSSSSDSIYMIFQNAVDIFCSYLPQGNEKMELVNSIGAKLNIIQSRCEYYTNEHRPSIKFYEKSIIIGRAELLFKDLCEKQKRKSMQNQQKYQSTFSFTKNTLCLLERISVPISQNEPILLVGETGVGKTTCVQYLAEKTLNKLVVINMNNQSDISDLIGGYKPVDLCYILSPIRNEFESVFRKTFDENKNEDFLNKFSICYNQGNYIVLVKLMLNVAESTIKKNKKIKLICFKEWQLLRDKLSKLNSQLSKSINISFAFITGSLVNCIKNGDWVLLDEINLASAETLECLTTILEANGSIILLEKGDFVPVKRHPNFRIFACMNPSTDIGKKDLAIGIRNRFTELFVDEITKDSDLIHLVTDYLQNTGIEKRRVSKIVELYKHLKQLTNLELNDGLGNRPVFSLRTLCRALRICAKNLCGSIERNLYESFSLSFLTQLDSNSHNVVSNLIEITLLSSKSILKAPIPPPVSGDYLNFEGYWIEKGIQEIDECENYILTKSVRSNLKVLSRIISIGKLPILLQGPTSAGKTSLIEYVARRSGNRCLRINNHEHTDLQEYIGTYSSDLSGMFKFNEGVLVDAMRNGYWIILDELNLASSDILEALNRVLDDNRELFIPETQTVIKAHPNFMLFATQNPPGLYGGRKVLSRAFKNRFIELHFSEIPRDELETILEKRCKIPESYAKKMVKCMWDLQKNRHTVTTQQMFTLRDMFRWGNRYTFADSIIENDNKYDWNQHLVEEGYLVLSAKVRSCSEIAYIESTLNKYFKKTINSESLFSFTENNSMVTRNIINDLKQYCDRYKDIVWTRNMTIMAVLTAKAINFNEPVLLIGPTGCGKTTVCQIISNIYKQKLRILNCHMHTEGADFLGGLRPCRHNTRDSKQIFEWADGPLVLAMKEGNFFMADEISLAEDSVLERLNSILEPERTLLISEKGGLTDSNNFIVKADKSFQFFATMNPGGDFGKKELSPALRNRFTEIWCKPPDSKEDLIKIVSNSLKENLSDAFRQNVKKIAEYVIDIVYFIHEQVEYFKFSIRDILALCTFYNTNWNLPFLSATIFGLETVFLDSLEMTQCEQVEKKRIIILNYAISKMDSITNTKETIYDIASMKGEIIISNNTIFGIDPFFLSKKSNIVKKENSFLFGAPTTKQNIFRLLSALTLKKPILLEGPPGVGKTSSIENLAKAVGSKIVRINLCEHTDLSDLFGTDLPSDEIDYNEKNSAKFEWKDGPLLAALKSENAWILLDELNLAPQSVLEGLNAILDHRGEAYIPELNKTFKLGSDTRIFACQNPLGQGGGRKGLPQSFLNRFTKVFIKKLSNEDLLFVLNGLYATFFDEVKQKFSISLAEKMVTFSEKLDKGVSDLKFGHKGGPFEINLRDILRWCEALTHTRTGRDLKELSSINEFYTLLFEKMKLIYYQRMRCTQDKQFILTSFGNTFNISSEKLNDESQNVSLYWTDTKIYLNEIVLNRKNYTTKVFNNLNYSPLLLTSQREYLKNIAECVFLKKPVLLVGSSDSGKTKAIDSFCWITGQNCYNDTIDDSVTGSFQQVDLNRHLENYYREINEIKSNFIISELSKNDITTVPAISSIMELWQDYQKLESVNGVNIYNSMSDECLLFKKRIHKLKDILNYLTKIQSIDISNLLIKLDNLQTIAQKSQSLNTGGSFEWVDSQIVTSIKKGEFLSLEHANFCSPAVLDRLNSVFEPNGSILISEKGVANSKEECEIIYKHPNFQAFLTIDSKNGELSRPMRNRCVELALCTENYSIDDLRLIVYSNGVKDIHLIQAVLSIHNEIDSLNGFSSLSLSHLTKFAFLVSSYLKISYTCQDSIFQAAMEVYVYSCNVDPIGFGLEHYRNKLNEIIRKYSLCTPTSNGLSLYNVALNCDNINKIDLVALQTEPLKYMNRSINLNLLLYSLDNIQFEDNKVMLNYYIYILYEISSINDINLRKIYIRNILKGNEAALNINDKLFDALESFKYKVLTEQCLPWNTKMFPRIRDYKTKNVILEIQISLTLICHFLFNEVKINEGKLSKLTVISYSSAVSSKSINDKFNNIFIKHLFTFLNSIKSIIILYIQNRQSTIKEYLEISLSFLWFNRMLDLASNKIMKDQNLNKNLIDKLIVHFEWLNKHLMTPSLHNLNEEFDRSYEKLISYSRSVNKPINILNKLYVKKMVDFVPIYIEEQIFFDKIYTSFNDFMELTPRYGIVSLPLIHRKFQFMISSECNTLKNDLRKKLANIWTVFFQKKTNLVGSNSIIQLLDELFAEIEERAKTKISEDIDIFAIESKINLSLNKFHNDYEDVEFNINDIIEDEFDVNAVRNYFLLKALTQAYKNPTLEINEKFCQQNSFLNCMDYQLIDIIRSKEYKLFAKVWHELAFRVNDNFSDVFNLLGSNYKLISSFHRNLQNMLNIYKIKQSSINNNTQTNHQTKSDLKYDGPEFTKRMLTFLMDETGNKKCIPLKSIHSCQNSITKVNQMIWSNWFLQQCNYNKNNFEIAQESSIKMLEEIKYLDKICHFVTDRKDEDFKKIFDKLLICSKRLPQNNIDTVYLTGMMNSLTGCLELCLNSSIPLIDPVEKNNLKNKYIEEDIDHLIYMKTSYKVMQKVMKYEYLGNEVTLNLCEQIGDLEVKKQKYQRKSAFRPKICLYGEMSAEIKHFLLTNGNPCNLMAIIDMVDEKKKCFDIANNIKELEISDVIKRLDLWIINSQRFLSHSLSKYTVYYKDFTLPIEYALNTIRLGFESFKSVLQQKYNSIIKLSTGAFINMGLTVNEMLINIIEYPTTPINLYDEPSNHNCDLFHAILENADLSGSLYFNLLKVKMLEIRHTVTKYKKIDSATFNDLNYVLKMYNQIWKQEEEMRMKSKENSERLYTTINKCSELNEEMLEDIEIQQYFPTNIIAEDYAEFLEGNYLSMYSKKTKETALLAQQPSLLMDAECKFITDNFIFLMQHLSDFNTADNIVVTAQSDHVNIMKSRLEIFSNIFFKYKNNLNEDIDEAVYNTFALIFGAQHQQIDNSFKLSSPSYNYYKHSNIPELLTCTDILKEIELKVTSQLQLYPDHATLNDINKIINRIRNLPSSSSLVRFNSGLQLLRHKLSQWNEVAHSKNNLQSEEILIAECIKKWNILELQSWRSCLTQINEKIEASTSKYWFYIYNLLVEYLESNTISQTYKSLETVENMLVNKNYENDFFIKESVKTNLEEIINILRQFLELSSFGDFHIRISLLKSFQQFIYRINVDDEKKKNKLLSSLHNLQIYYNQFSYQIEQTKKSMRVPIERRLREFVKIESYNKDLSYFSMKNNISRAHRNLNKFLKEYEYELKTKITSVFQADEANSHDFKSKSEFVNEILVDNFIVPEVYSSQLKQISSTSLLKKINNLFLSSRKVVEVIITSAKYPTYISKFNELFGEQIENYEYLQELKVDRSQEKCKQILQSKQITRQRRMGLSNFFKMLPQFGLNFKRGLMELSMENDVIDYDIKPFNLNNISTYMNSSVKETIDNNYAKCAFKLRILKHIMLTPIAELGSPNVDRMKGFSLDMFLIMQKQRKLLSDSVESVHNLKKIIGKIDYIIKGKDCSSQNFTRSKNIIDSINMFFYKAMHIFEQLVVLLNILPENSDENNNVICTNTDQLQGIKIECNNILQQIVNANKLFDEFDIDFPLNTDVEKLQVIKSSVLNSIIKMIETYSSSSLLNTVRKFIHSQACVDHNYEQNEEFIESIDYHLDNIVHKILISMQKLYKQYEAKSLNEEFGDDIENRITDNLLSLKLYSGLFDDWSTLKVNETIISLQQIFEIIFNGNNIQYECINSFSKILPILKQYYLLLVYFVQQQLSSHYSTVKALNNILGVFITMSIKGFCIPKDLIENENEKGENSQQGEGFGLEDGTGEKDVSDKLESEDQLENAKKPDDSKNEKQDNCKEEKGIEMNDNFEAEQQDIDELKNQEEDDSGESDNDSELDKEMGETENDAEKLDEQIWGDDEEKDNADEDLNNGEGKGSTEENDQLNDLSKQNDKAENENTDENERLNANESPSNKDKSEKSKKEDSEQIEDQTNEEEQSNQIHNDLEQPPQPEDMNLGEIDMINDEENQQDNIDENNPFDIDFLKENMDKSNVDDEANDIESDQKESEDGGSDSEEDQDAGNKEEDSSYKEEEEDGSEMETSKFTSLQEDDTNFNGSTEDLLDDKIQNEYKESNDKLSKEENIQSQPQTDNKSSNDLVGEDGEDLEQTEPTDEQNCGDEKDGTGLADNEKSDQGHQGISISDKSEINENSNKSKSEQKKRQCETNDQRSLGETESKKIKQLKTVKPVAENTELDKSHNEADEYQHIKDAEENQMLTLDSATEKQSKEVIDKREKVEDNDFMEVEDEPILEETIKELQDIDSDKNSKEQSNQKKNKENIFENLLNEILNIEGEEIKTINVPRGEETTAHMQKYEVIDKHVVQNFNTEEMINWRKKYIEELQVKNVSIDSGINQIWERISQKMLPSARELCEQLRLILEPTKCSNMKGDYRTGRRINMKKIIPYIASQFRKDKIWLRRTKPAQRDYKITIAIDDSKSMCHNNSKDLTLKAISLIYQALSLLESGKLSIVSFGEAPHLILNHTDLFDGPKLVQSLNFSQDKTNIAELLNFIRFVNLEESGLTSENGYFENLLLILSDGQNIYGEGKSNVQAAVKLARLQRIFLVYVIIDNPDNKHSILDNQTMEISADKGVIIKQYLDEFPFPYYVIVRDLKQLPSVLSCAMRQWFELVNSEK